MREGREQDARTLGHAANAAIAALATREWAIIDPVLRCAITMDWPYMRAAVGTGVSPRSRCCKRLHPIRRAQNRGLSRAPLAARPGRAYVLRFRGRPPPNSTRYALLARLWRRLANAAHSDLPLNQAEAGIARRR